MNNILVTLLLIVSLYFIYVLWVRPLRIIKRYARELRNRGYKVLEVPYNPLKNDMITTMAKGRQLGDVLKLYKQDRKDYDVIVSNTLSRPRLQFHHPDFIKDYFSVDKHYDFHKTQNVVSVFERVSGKGLTFSEGENWKRKRNIFNKIFNFDFVKSQTFAIAKICDQATLQIETKYQQTKTQNSITFPIIQWTVRVFSGVILQIFLGGDLSLKIDNVLAGDFIKKLMTDISSTAFTPISFILGPKLSQFIRTKQRIDIDRRIEVVRAWGFDFIHKRIQQINEKYKDSKDHQPSDILQALYLANLQVKDHKQTADEFKMHEQEIFDEFMSFFIAGTDTTSNYTQMVIYELARHSQVQKKVRAQIQEHMKTNDYSYQNVKKLKYFDLVQKEVTRTYGPVNLLFSRKAQKDTYLNGLLIKKGTGLSIFQVGNHYSQKYFDRPYEFRPERWEGQQCNKTPSFALGGFSAGARTCIGKHLALLENKIATIKFLKRYSKLSIPKTEFKMFQRFVYSPQDFDTTLEIDTPDQKQLAEQKTQLFFN